MLSPAEFVKEWSKIADNLVKFPANLLNDAQLPDISKQFLIEAGLPRITHRITSFDTPFNGRFETPDDSYPMPNGDRPHQKHKIIGYNTYGDFIYIDEENDGRIIEVSHETFEAKFYNSSIPQLAECLLIWHERLQFADPSKVQVQDHYEKFLYAHIPISAKTEVEQEIDRIDLAALQGYTVWREWLNSIKEK